MISVSRTAIELFGFRIHWYGVLIVLGVALAVMLAMKREMQLGLREETTLDLALWCIPAAIIGARAYYVAFSWESFASQPWWKVFAIREGGMAVYGGVIAGVLTGWVFARARKIPFAVLADLAAPCIPLGQAIGRWGNFVNQEAHGGWVENPALRFFPMAVQIDGGWYYATFFYESLWCFLIVFLLLALEKKRGFRKNGDAFLLYVFLYALERCVVEGLRTDSLYIGAFRVSQLLSIGAALAAAGLWIVRRKSTDNRIYKRDRGE